jgi:hypothetical protein
MTKVLARDALDAHNDDDDDDHAPEHTHVILFVALVAIREDTIERPRRAWLLTNSPRG